MAPPVSYAVSSDGTHIAWLQAGDGPLDVLYVPTWISQCEHLWAHPRVAHFFERIASFSRVIMFDRRGSGLSDPIGEGVTLAAIGCVLGVVATVAGGRVLQDMLYQVQASDGVTLSVVLALVLGVAVAACLAPAWRAARQDPVLALREE